MNSMGKVANEVRVKNEPICDSQSINHQPNKSQSNKQSIKQEKLLVPISDSKRIKDQPNKLRRLSIEVNKVKEEPIDNEMQTSESHIQSTSEEIGVKAEEKFSATEEFAKNKTSIRTASIAFLNEETTQETTKNINQA